MSAALNDNTQLEFTQALRRQLISQYVTEGKFPDDPKMLNILLNALKDHDKVTLTLKRIDADKENSDADREALAAFQRLSGMMGANDPHRAKTPAVEEREPTFNPGDIPDVPLVAGELEVAPKQIDYDELMERLDKEHRDGLA